MGNTIAVGMGEVKVAKFPDSLAAYGVGSCVIVFMYDPKTKCGGGAHIMLPDSSGLDKNKINHQWIFGTLQPAAACSTVAIT